MSTHDAREWVHKFQNTTHELSGGKNAALPSHVPYLYPNETEVLSTKRRLMKKDCVYLVFRFRYYITYTHSRLPIMFDRFSVCTTTCPLSVLSKAMSLITSKLINCEVLYFSVITQILQTVFLSPICLLTDF